MPPSNGPSIAFPRPIWVCSTVAGIGAGVVYTFSATTTWFLLLLPILFVWAGRALGARERRWVLGLLGVAVIARLTALYVFFLLADRFRQPFGVLIGDERFIQNQSLRMLQLGFGHRLEAIDYVDRFGDYGGGGLLQYLLAMWQLWFGASPYGAHLINVAMWLVGVIALHRTVRLAFGPLVALGGFSVLLFMPTLFVWSISALKEPAYFLLTAMTIVGVMAVFRKRRLETKLWGALMVLSAITLISWLRSIALAVTAGGIVLAAAGWLATRRAWVCVTVVFVSMAAGMWAARQPEAQMRLMPAFRLAAISHLGAVNTPGYGYRLLDWYFYTRFEPDYGLSYMEPADAARFSVRAAVSFFAVPAPWDIASRPGLLLLPQQLVWYILAALGAVGVVAGWRRDAAFTWLLVSNGLIGGAAVALHNGNVGTLVRMRDTVVPVIIWLSVLGGGAALEWSARHSSQGGAGHGD